MDCVRWVFSAGLVCVEVLSCNPNNSLLEVIPLTRILSIPAQDCTQNVFLKYVAVVLLLEYQGNGFCMCISDYGI